MHLERYISIKGIAKFRAYRIGKTGRVKNGEKRKIDA